MINSVSLFHSGDIILCTPADESRTSLCVARRPNYFNDDYDNGRQRREELQKVLRLRLHDLSQLLRYQL